MKKNLLWIVALLATLALVVTGCPGGGDDPEDTTSSFKLDWYIGLDDPDADTGAIQKASPPNTITFTPKSKDAEDVYVRIFWNPPGASFDKIRITFTANPGANVSWQAIWDAQGQWGKNDYEGWYESDTIEVAPSFFGGDWKPTGATAVDVKSVYGICLVLNIEDVTTFTVANVVLTGLSGAGGGSTPGGNEGGGATYDPITDAKWTTTGAPTLGSIISITGISTTASNATLGKIDSTNALRVDWQADSKGEDSEIRVEFAVSPALDISGKTKFVMKFVGEGGASESMTFNVSPFVVVNTGWGAILQKTGAGTIEFVFATDLPGWGEGTIADSDGLLTGFEIYVDTADVPVLYITGFSVE